MTPGPYQSNLFRFVIGQYRQGMDRHRRAVRGARTTAAWGLGVGATVTLLPLVTIAKASHDAGRRLRKSVTSRRLFRIRSQADKLLDFSGFDGLSDLDAVVGDDASVEKVLDSLEHQAIARTLLAVGACLSPRQVKLLSAKTPENETATLGDLSNDGSAREPVVKGPLVRGPLISSITSFFRGSFTAWRKPATANLARSASVELDPLDGGDNQLAQPTCSLSTTGRITGVASDLKTRDLVMIRDYKIVWQGLSVEQQRQLKGKIELFLKGDYPVQSDELAWLRRQRLNHGKPSLMDGTRQLSRKLFGEQQSSAGEKQALIQRFIPNPLSIPNNLSTGSSVASLVRPVRTFWIEVLRVLAWLYRGRGHDPVDALSGRLTPLGGSASMGGQLVAAPVASSGVEREMPTIAPMAWLKRLVASMLPLAMLAPNAIAISTTSSETTAISSYAVADQGLIIQDGSTKQSVIASRMETAPVHQAAFDNHDWLEAHVLAIEYVEHPLEKVLKWVDRFLLWLEGRLQALWQLFRTWWF